VQDSPVPDDAIFSDHTGDVPVHMEYASVLYVGPPADPDRSDVSTQNGRWPNAHIRTKDDLSHQNGGRMDPGRGVQGGVFSTEGFQHGSKIAFFDK
jgi:hypothetical protein